MVKMKHTFYEELYLLRYILEDGTFHNWLRKNL
jgi:hypothetical protein